MEIRHAEAPAMVVEKIETFACRLWKKSAEPAELGLVQLFDVFFIKGLGQRQATSYRIYYQWIDYWMILCFFFCGLIKENSRTGRATLNHEELPIQIKKDIFTWSMTSFIVIHCAYTSCINLCWQRNPIIYLQIQLRREILCYSTLFPCNM